VSSTNVTKGRSHEISNRYLGAYYGIHGVRQLHFQHVLRQPWALHLLYNLLLRRFLHYHLQLIKI